MKHLLSVLVMITLIILKSNTSLACDFIYKLGTPEGATAVACTYGVLQGVSNFLWAFDWEKYGFFSEEAAHILQEIGGLSASAECFLFGALVPVMLYLYKKNHPHANPEEVSEQPG